MKMHRDDIIISQAWEGGLIALAKMNAFNHDWPQTLEYGNREYKFAGQEPLEHAHASHFSGSAKYLEKVYEIGSRIPEPHN